MRRAPKIGPASQRVSNGWRSSPRHVLGWTIAAALIPLLALLVLFILDVPIGQPFFLVYRYSSLWPVRILRAVPALLIGLVAVGVLYRAFHSNDRLGRGTWAAVIVCFAALCGWTFFGPPDYVKQQIFNLLSPSHDGAFVLEGWRVESIRDYVSSEFYQRLQLSVEEMRGRRVLSNPPGVTVLSVLTERLVHRVGGVRYCLINFFELETLEDSQQEARFAAGLLFGLIFTAAWATAVVFAYGLCRLWLPQSAALCVAFACVFNPATVNFAPGKDPAQLLFVLAILYGWLKAHAFKRGRWGVVGGVASALGCMIGLIHVWIAIIAAAATFWHASRAGKTRDWVTHCAVPALAGFGAVAALAYLALDWNLPRTLYLVARRYGEIQLPIITDPFYWTLVGLPMFLLFVGLLFWVQAIAITRDARDDTAALGGALLFCTSAVMAYSYFFANNSETPRLWIPFIPLLLIAMSLRRSPFRQATPERRKLHVLLILLQLTVTFAFWSLMDARESEWRLLTGRMWD